VSNERKHAAPEGKRAARHRRASRLVERICKVIGHDEENVSTGDRFCHRCRNTLGRWRP